MRGFHIKNIGIFEIECIMFALQDQYTLIPDPIITGKKILDITIGLGMLNWKIFFTDYIQIGIKTGPNNDFVCVKKCDTLADAKHYESPKIASFDNFNAVYIKELEEYNCHDSRGIIRCIFETIKKWMYIP